MVEPDPDQRFSEPSLTALIIHMSDVVLPGELVDAKHPNLKLGPGLLQLSDGSTVSTKAGILCHNQNRSKWWVESNSRRVCTEHQSHFRVFTTIHFSTSLPLRNLSLVSSSVKVVRKASESISAVHTTPTSTHSPLRVLQNGTGQISRWGQFRPLFYFLPTLIGWMSGICARFFIQQRYGTGDRMLRCTNPQISRFRRTQGRVRHWM